MAPGKSKMDLKTANSKAGKSTAVSEKEPGNENSDTLDPIDEIEKQSGNKKELDKLEKREMVKKTPSNDLEKEDKTEGGLVLEGIDSDKVIEDSELKGKLQEHVNVDEYAGCLPQASSVALYENDQKDSLDTETKAFSECLPHNDSEDINPEVLESFKIQTITIDEDEDLFDFEKTEKHKIDTESTDMCSYNNGNAVVKDNKLTCKTGVEEPAEQLQKFELYKYLTASNVDEVKSSEVTPMHSDHDSNEESDSVSEEEISDSGSYTSASSEDDQDEDTNHVVEDMQDDGEEQEMHEPKQPDTEIITEETQVIAKPKPTPVRKQFRPRLTKKMRNLLAKTTERLKKSKEVTDKWLKELELPQNLDLSNPVRLNINDLNQYLTCGLCSGYLYEASTVTECMHTFCKTCIVKHCMEVSLNCPVCNILIHPTDPFVNIRLDRMIQDIVYKLLPDIAAAEMKNIREFYAAHPGVEAKELYNCPDRPKTSPAKSEVFTDPCPLVSLVLESESESPAQTDLLQKKFVRVRGTATVANLSHFLRTKLNLDESQDVDIFCHGDLIEESNFTLQTIKDKFFTNNEDCLMLLQYRVGDP